MNPFPRRTGECAPGDEPGVSAEGRSLGGGGLGLAPNSSLLSLIAFLIHFCYHSNRLVLLFDTAGLDAKMRVVTAAEMRELDRRAIQEYCVPGVVLMENAAAAVVAAVDNACAGFTCGGLKNKRVAIFCGAGNNGGDGYAAARQLKLRGAQPAVYMLSEADQLIGDALVHYTAMSKSGVDIRSFTDKISDVEFNGYDLVVDAMLGTGLRSAPRELYAKAIRIVNDLGRRIPVIAVDIPSGVDADTGAAPGEAVSATTTVTFAYPKMGMFLFPGAAKIGNLVVDNIGFDWNQICYRTEDSARCDMIEPADFHALFAARPQNSNKGDFGHVGIIAGSRGMAGAPALVARSAQRVGAGLVTVFTPESTQPALAIKLDEQMTAPLPEVDGCVSLAAFDRIAEFSVRAGAICIGPGLTTHGETVKLVQRLIAELKVPIVLDADGLNALAIKPEIIDNRGSNTDAPLILTPHPGEAARLLGISISKVEADRVASVRKLAQKYSAIALLKGRYTLISDPEGHVSINTTGNPGMASGGMGDTLTGVVGGLLAQSTVREAKRGDSGKSLSLQSAARLAACAGAYLHGAAGDMAATEHGEAGTTAGDVIRNLPAAIRAIREVRGSRNA